MLRRCRKICSSRGAARRRNRCRLRSWRALARRHHALEHAKATASLARRRTPDPHLEVIAHQRELDTAALPDAELLPKLLRDGDLSLAGDRRDFHAAPKYYVVILTEP